MRPKIVISILVAAFGVLGLIAVLKGVSGRNASNGQVPVAETTIGVHPETATEAPISSGGVTNSVPVSDEIRSAVIAKEVEQVQDILGQADGTNNAVVLAALVEKMANPEAEVRQAALEALKQLNDTNAVPGLTMVAESTKDPREKVAVLDAIEYIQMPSATDGAPPESAIRTDMGSVTNRQIAEQIYKADKLNPNFSRKGKGGRIKNPGQQTAPAGTPQ